MPGSDKAGVEKGANRDVGDGQPALNPDDAPGRDSTDAGSGAQERVRASLAMLLRSRLLSRKSGRDAEAAWYGGFAMAVRADLDRGRGLVWACIAFGLGIAGYFQLPREPSLPALLGVCVFLWGLFLSAHRNGRAAALLLACAVVLSGTAAASLRTVLVSAPILERARSVTLSGFVERAETRAGGRLRLTIRVVDAPPLRGDSVPKRVRVSVRGADAAFETGNAVRLRARLMPPAPAVMPGGYDYSFRAFFDGVGASGFAFGAPEKTDLGPVPRDLRLMAGIDGLRRTIAERILQTLGTGVAGGLAVALIVGDRSSIPPETTEALRTAGLAHILAISGLHMALFAGAVFFSVRAVLALSARLSQNRPIDLWAAGAALAAATFYLAISGGSIATQRAFVMIALVLAGRLLGRRALTLRNAALAAFFILVVTPEALLDPGFQMSFAAVVALIAAYEEMTRRRARTNPRDQAARGLVMSAIANVALWLGAILMTSLIAGAATGAIGAFHFHRIAPLGPLINLVAMPLVTVLVMPMAVLALALLPFGLEVLPLSVMGLALEQVAAISSWAQAATPGEGVIGMLPLSAILLVVTGGGVLCLAPAGYRHVALVPLVFAGLALALHRPPDMLVSANGKAIAVRDSTGRLQVTARPSSFLGDVWLRADAVTATERNNRHLTRRRMACDDRACIASAYPGGGARAAPAGVKPADMLSGTDTAGIRPLTISLVSDPSAFAQDCVRVDVIVTALRAPVSCAAPHVFDASSLARTGAIAIYLEPRQGAPPQVMLRSSYSALRPWTPKRQPRP
ncbi:ComEC/Rec2 family competence protein [Stappia stellulata]|uniref:ComEC/Rec2 family competence protein n=1 Tax=Stappia stellulata TaxID=71235 RepID=UPI000421C61B|nr:ComEC/Rec2 family competence protein [Stappia stellulata]